MNDFNVFDRMPPEVRRAIISCPHCIALRKDMLKYDAAFLVSLIEKINSEESAVDFSVRQEWL